MPSTIYLDHNASTPPHPEVLEVMAAVSRDAYGNPGSRHAAGRAARRILETARESLAQNLEADPSEVVFTSGGTEAVNLALRGLAAGRSAVIAVPPGEHPSTEETVRSMERLGWRRWTLPIDEHGRIVAARLDEVPWSEVRLATSLLAHNETGVIRDLQPLGARCGEHRIPLHVDAVQAVGKIEVRFRTLGVDAMSVAAHKFQGPRGIGAVLIRRGVRLAPLLFGGHQESRRRPGTEAAALAAGMARALEIRVRDREALTRRIEELRDRLELGLREAGAPAVAHGVGAPRLPNTLNIAFPGCDGDALLVALDLEGVCASLGSACASGSAEPAPILVAMGCPAEVYKSSLRFSLGADTTPEEIDSAVTRIAAIVRRLRTSA